MSILVEISPLKRQLMPDGVAKTLPQESIESFGRPKGAPEALSRLTGAYINKRFTPSGFA
jgi:hypothetical protein